MIPKRSTLAAWVVLQLVHNTRLFHRLQGLFLMKIFKLTSRLAEIYLSLSCTPLGHRTRDSVTVQVFDPQISEILVPKAVPLSLATVKPFEFFNLPDDVLTFILKEYLSAREALNFMFVCKASFKQLIKTSVFQRYLARKYWIFALEKFAFSAELLHIESRNYFPEFSETEYYDTLEFIKEHDSYTMQKLLFLVLERKQEEFRLWHLERLVDIICFNYNYSCPLVYLEIEGDPLDGVIALTRIFARLFKDKRDWIYSLLFKPYEHVVSNVILAFLIADGTVIDPNLPYARVNHFINSIDWMVKSEQNYPLFSAHDVLIGQKIIPYVLAHINSIDPYQLLQLNARLNPNFTLIVSHPLINAFPLGSDECIRCGMAKILFHARKYAIL